MELKIKSLKRTEMSRILDKKFSAIEVNEKYFCGIVAMLTFIDIASPLYVPSPIGKVCIADKNYKWLQFAPKNSNWWLTVMFDDKNQIIESYFDITQKKCF